METGKEEFRLSEINECKKLAEHYRSLLSAHLESPHLFYKLALALCSCCEYEESYLAITKCLHRSPDDILALLLAGKLCLNYLNKSKEAVQHSQRALAIISNTSCQQKSIVSSISSYTHTSNSLPLPLPLHCSLLLSTLLLHGIASSQHAYNVHTYSERNSLQSSALLSLQQAQQLSPNDSRTYYALALLYADIRDISFSFTCVKKSLELNNTVISSWYLLALLLTAEKKYTESIKAIDTAVQICNNNKPVVLLLLKAKLLSFMGQFDESINCINSLIPIVFDNYDYLMMQYGNKEKKLERPIFRAKNQIHNNNNQNKNNNTNYINNINYNLSQSINYDESGIQTLSSFKADLLLTLSQIYSNQAQVMNNTNAENSNNPNPSTLPTSNLNNWSNLSSNELFSDALDCIFTAKHYSLPYQLSSLYYLLGSLYLQLNKQNDAIHYFENTLIIDPIHINSLLSLCQLYSNKNLILAYNYASTALNIDASNYKVWYEMGDILIKQKKEKQANDFFLTANELEYTTPIIPFAYIRRCV